MIAVAPQHVAQVTLVPLIEELAETVLHLRDAPHVEGFVHHDESHAITQLSSSGEGGLWLVRIAFTPIDLHDLELAFGGAPIHGRAQRAEVVVIADALELAVAAIQQEALLGVEVSVRMPNGVT